jgi:hypothetical protein
MKKYLTIGIVSILTLFSCEKTYKEIFLRLGNGKEFRFSDIELYDTSVNVLYFKESYDGFSEFNSYSFTFLDDGYLIYSGSFLPGYSSYIPTGPFIYSPSMMQDYALQIVNWYNDGPDVRKCQRMISVLKENGLLHSGLAITESSIEIAGTQLTFRFTVTNKDESDLLIIDINKTGPELFHYFTNGLYIRNADNQEVFSDNIQHQKPDPWNSWKIEWLSQLKSGASKEFTINYTLSKPIPAGEYRALFEFPGLSYQVAIDELHQGTDRIFLGDVPYTKKIIIP